MKKLFTLFLTLVASVGIIEAEKVQIGDLFYDLDINNKTATVTYQEMYSENNYSSLATVNIPDSIKYNAVSYSVIAIGNYAFYSSPNLFSITIPNSVTSIGIMAFGMCTGLTSIEIPNSVTGIEAGAFYLCSSLTSIEIPNSVISIGDYAFYCCSSLTSITIPNSVTTFGEEGTFYLCKGLTSIYNYALTPQAIDSTAFGGTTGEFEGVLYGPVDKSTCKLYVPEESIELYQAAEGWKEFVNILPIVEEEVDVETTTTETTATIAWPQVTGAASYELVINDKDGNIICTLTFNSQGQLTSIAFHAPSKNGAPQQEQATGFSFTITNLEGGATYSYTLTAKNSAGNVIDTKTGTFTTKAPEGIDDIGAPAPATKILHNGQVLILRGDKTYTITGAEVR